MAIATKQPEALKIRTVRRDTHHLSEMVRGKRGTLLHRVLLMIILGHIDINYLISLNLSNNISISRHVISHHIRITLLTAITNMAEIEKENSYHLSLDSSIISVTITIVWFQW